jgi:hypothetical protein
VTAAGGLEESYRRLLRWYPPVYRHRHEEEILGVLMATAQPGQRRPRVRDSLDLLWWGLKVRIRIVLRGESQSWAPAFAQVSVLLPLLMVLLKLTDFLLRGGWYGFGTPADVLIGGYGDPGVYTGSFHLNPFSVALTGNMAAALTAGPGPALILAVLALIGWRRTAAVFAVLVPLAYVGVSLAGGYTLLGGPYAAVMVYAYALEALILLAAPSSPRGWRALRWRPSALLIVATLAGGIAMNGGIWPLLHVPFRESVRAVVASRPYESPVSRVLGLIPRWPLRHPDRLLWGVPGIDQFIDRLLGIGAGGWSDWFVYQGTLVAVIVAALLIMLLSSPGNCRALALIAVPIAGGAVIYLCSLINPPLPGLAGDTLAVLPLVLLFLLAVMAKSLSSWRPADPAAP